MVEFPPSLWADLDGPVHYVDFGGPAGAQVIVCVHGLGGSHANWLAIAPQLARTHRVLALDLAGFGLTRAGARSTSVQANTALLHRFVTEVVPTLDGVAAGPVVLVGNSMGGLITALEAADHPGDVAGVALIDPALPLGPRSLPGPAVVAGFAVYLAPGLGAFFMRGRRTVRTPEQVARDILRFCCADADRVPAEIVRAHVELGHRREAYTEMDAEFVAATRSLIWLLRGRRRVLRTLRTIRCPVLLLHGDSDPLIPLAAARRVAAALPRWRFEVAPRVGHVPMLEDPEFTLDVLADWLPVTQARARQSSEQPTAGAG
ncbi:MAG: alpha/beta hydrolase [Pseudonocardiales bacterium]|nr:alpha/beta hydrolase [Pseudonocardiales bacterium]